MPLQLPVLDDRNFEQLLEEARRRIPSFTPEWTNFGGDSDPGITIIQLFAVLTENLLYRANRIPERNRLKFLQLLGIPIQPAAPADGLIVIQSGRGPLQALPLNAGVVVSAGSVDFLTRDPVNVLPLEAQVYYKQTILKTDPLYDQYNARYEAILAAQLAAQEDTSDSSGTGAASAASAPSTTTVELAFYETAPMPAPTAADPSPVVDLVNDTIDRAIYIALLAPKNVDPATVRPIIANQTLSIGVVPSLAGQVPPLMPLQITTPANSSASLIYEISNLQGDNPTAQYNRLKILSAPDVLTTIGVVQVQLPGLDGLQSWSFPDPLEEGTGDFPPRIDDDQVSARIVTWVRLRLPTPSTSAPASVLAARLTWVGINAARVQQAVPVFNELAGIGTGEPNQVFTLANRPVLPASISVVVQDVDTNTVTVWRLVSDLLSAGPDDAVFMLDPEAAQVTTGDGLTHGARPQRGWRVLVSYEYGGGIQGNVGIGAIKTSRDLRLQGGYTIESPVATSGGDVGQSVADAEQNIPLYIRNQDRLVTVDDFHDVVIRTPGVDVGRAEVLPLFRPADPVQGTPAQTDAPGVVTVLVVPQFDPVSPFWPTPDRLFLQRVCSFLDQRRLVTTELYVRGPEYVPVYVSVGIQVQAGFFADLVQTAVRDTLNAYLSSLPPGGLAGAGWPLSKRLMSKDLEAVITRVPGVEYVDSIEMGVNSPVDVPDSYLTGLQLPVLVGLNIVEGTAEPLASVFGAPAQPGPPLVQIVPVPVLKKKC
ncbi:MAG: putative baseplate assembly protein [Chloroflexota bacterium]